LKLGKKLDDTTIETRIPQGLVSREGSVGPLALVTVYNRAQPDRIGEVAFLDGDQLLGRGEGGSGDEAERVRFYRQRPGSLTPSGPLESEHVSRRQCILRARNDRVEVESVGRCPMLVDGTLVARAEVGEGDTLAFANELVFYVTRRPLAIPPLPTPYDEFSFGTADKFGIVGESAAAWKLRADAMFAAQSEQHVLVLGESGAGKELCATAVHGLSRRANKKMVARNAATIPEGLVDAELFGHAKNYPNPGMPEREGLVGDADGSTLFLDEIGELPARLQAHLLRVLDTKGEFQRLGETNMRRSDLRLIAATNRLVADLKHDFAARLTLRVKVPPFSDRREDIPLLVRHLLAGMAKEHPQVSRFFAEGIARIDAELVDALVRHEYKLHARELATLLWQAVSESDGPVIAMTPSVRAALVRDEGPTPAGDDTSNQPTREQIEAALARNRGNVTRASRELGLKNRFALYRLMKTLGVAGGGE
jgi:transcriptional regulator with AAA-type ATPase domain